MACKNLYMLYDEDLFIGEFTSVEISKQIKCTTNNVATAAKTGAKIQKRYRIEQTYDRLLIKCRDVKLLIDFDLTAGRILKLLKEREIENEKKNTEFNSQDESSGAFRGREDENKEKSVESIPGAKVPKSSTEQESENAHD